jgi:hypothetical protein
MRKLVGYTISWTLYRLGDLVSHPMDYFDWDWLYSTYNKLMISSMLVQDWAGNDTPWEKTNG